MKRVCSYVLLLACTFLLTACSVTKTDKDKIRDIDFTVVDTEAVPEELAAQIEEARRRNHSGLLTGIMDICTLPVDMGQKIQAGTVWRCRNAMRHPMQSA